MKCDTENKTTNKYDGTEYQSRQNIKSVHTYEDKGLGGCHVWFGNIFDMMIQGPIPLPAAFLRPPPPH
jgi:hypothetical protein